MIGIDGWKSAANGVDRFAVANQNDRAAIAKRFAPTRVERR